MDQNSFWMSLAERYNELQSNRKRIELEEKRVKEEMISLQNNQPFQSGRYALDMVVRKGSVNYKDIPELKGIDLESYRGEEVTSWVFKKLW